MTTNYIKNTRQQNKEQCNSREHYENHEDDNDDATSNTHKRINDAKHIDSADDEKGRSTLLTNIGFRKDN